MIDLCKIKEDFSVLVKEAQPWTLTQFVMWLDLKLSEFKIKGYMVLDHHTKTKPKWIEVDDTVSEITPTPAPCRNCTKPTNDGTFYSDIHASPSSQRISRQHSHPEPMEDSENVRGEVGIIDLSHAEINRRDNSLRQHGQEISRQKTFQGPKFQEKSNVAVERDKTKSNDVIEIDPSSPTEKMFVTSNINKSSTPVPANPRSIPKSKNRLSLSMGTAIYTSTSSSTTPTFSSSYMSSTSRSMPPSFANRKYALGAPPPPIPVSVTSNLDEMIAQAVKYNEIKNTTDPSCSTQAVQSLSSFTDVRPVQQQPQKLKEIEPRPVQTNFSEPPSDQASFSDQNIFSQASTSAVPVALHANIDNISREISQNSAHSSSDTMEIKIESEVDNSINDSFFIGSGQLSDTSQTQDALHRLQDTSNESNRQFNEGAIPIKQGLVDPETARAYEMVELVNGSGVYVFQRTVSQAFKVGQENQTGTYSGEKMARYLLNVFWSRKELVGATLSKAGRGKKILNQQIIEAILDFCTEKGRHTRPKVYKAISDNLCTRSWRAKKVMQARLQNL